MAPTEQLVLPAHSQASIGSVDGIVVYGQDPVSHIEAQLIPTLDGVC